LIVPKFLDVTNKALARAALDVPELNDDGAVVADYVLAEGDGSVTQGLRFVGRIDIAGAPASGTWALEDVVQDLHGGLWKCVIAGTPGTWLPISPGFMNSPAVSYIPFKSYVNGPVTISGSPTSLPVANAALFPSGGGSLVISEGRPEGQDEFRVLATYTGKSGNNLTGVVTRDSTTKAIPDKMPVYWGGTFSSGTDLANGFLRVANGIIPRGARTGLPHDLVLCAARDDSGRSNRADYDIYLAREAGTTSVLAICLPVRFSEDVSFSEADGVELLTFSGGTANGANGANPNPLPSGTIVVQGKLVGGRGTFDGDLLMKIGHTDGKMLFLNASDVTRLGVDQTGAFLPNQTELRFIATTSTASGGIATDSSNRLNFRSPAAGYRFLNNAFDTVLFQVTETGVVTVNGSSATGAASVNTTNAALSSSSGVQYAATIAPTLTQSGTAGYTGLLINATETSTGSGAKLLIDARVGNSERFAVTNAGVARFRSPNGSHSAQMFVADSTSFTFNCAGANGYVFNNNANNATIFRVTDAGNALISGTLDLGNASDTTISRVSAGVIAVEGNTVATRLTNTATLDFGSVSAQSQATLTMTVTGAVAGDAVALGVPTASVTNGIDYTAWVSAADTVTVRAANYSAGAADPASGTFRATIIR
jgi:hypothetical protein